MSPRRRSARLGRVIETTPNVHQARFTPRTRSTKSIKSKGRPNLKKQDTLTQIGWVPSPSIRTNDDPFLGGVLEDGLPPSAQKPSKRRRAKQKSTLTQMDYLIRRCEHDIDDDLLRYDEEDKENIDVDLPKAKRRKMGSREAQDETIGQEIAINACEGAQRTMGKSMQHDSESQEQRGETFQRKDSSVPLISNDLAEKVLITRSPKRLIPSSQSTAASQELMPPPPITPARTRTREIPSSQSPITTPLSARSTRSSKVLLQRSPLKGRSINTALVPQTSSKEIKAPIKLFVADSMDSASQMSATSPSRLRRTLTTSTSEASNTMVHSSPVIVRKPSAQEDSSPRPSIHQIEDSDEDVVESPSVVTPLNLQKSTPATSIRPSAKRQTITLVPTKSPFKVPQSPHSTRAQRTQALLANISTMPTRPLPTLQVPSSPPLHTQREIQQSQRNVGPLTSPVLDTSQIKSPAPDVRPDPQDVSVQLLGDLAQDTHRQASLGEKVDVPALQTESQAEAAWRVLSSPEAEREVFMSGDLDLDGDGNDEESVAMPIPREDKDDRGEMVHVPSSQPPTPLTARQAKSKPKAVRHHSPCPSRKRTSASIIKSHRAPPPPPSQATTTDITQSPRSLPQVLPPSSPSSSSPTSNPRKRITRSKPSSLILSSSPSEAPKLTTTQADDDKETQETWHWNDGANRLTESQLLPESLLMDSMRGPPGYGGRKGREEERRGVLGVGDEVEEDEDL